MLRYLNSLDLEKAIILSVENDEDEKRIHFFTSSYKSEDVEGNGKDWRVVSYNFFIAPLNDVLREGIFKYFLRHESDYGQYCDECDKDTVVKTYFKSDKKWQPRIIVENKIDENIPVGTYIVLSTDCLTSLKEGMCNLRHELDSGEDEQLFILYNKINSFINNAESPVYYEDDIEKQIDKILENNIEDLQDGSYQDADTILSDKMENLDCEISGIGKEVFKIWKNSKDRESVCKLFYLLTDCELEDYAKEVVSVVDVYNEMADYNKKISEISGTDTLKIKREAVFDEYSSLCHVFKLMSPYGLLSKEYDSCREAYEDALKILKKEK